jgi:hypothetical protein
VPYNFFCLTVITSNSLYLLSELWRQYTALPHPLNPFFLALYSAFIYILFLRYPLSTSIRPISLLPHSPLALLTLILLKALGGTFEAGNVAFDFTPEVGPGGALYCPGTGGDVGTEKDTDRASGGGKVASAVGAVMTPLSAKGLGQGQELPARVHRDDSARVTEEMR